MKDIRLIALDLDGTTLQHTSPEVFEFSPRVRRAIQCAMDKGVLVTIATGRSVHATRPFAKQLSIQLPCLCQQGGSVYNFHTESAISHLLLDKDIAHQVVRMEEEFPHWHALVFDKDQIFISRQIYPNAFYKLVATTSIVEVPDLPQTIYQIEPEKVLFAFKPEETEAAYHLLAERVAQHASVVWSHPLCVEVNPLGATKGGALAVLAAELGIAQEHVMAIGDQGNDNSMIEWAGWGVAMGNANPNTQRLANWVAPTIQQDGAAAAIEKFVLGE